MTYTRDIKSVESPEVDLRQINLPAGIEVIRFLGEGRRSFSCKGRYDGQDVVIKIYRKEFIEKYLQRYNIDIAEFEFTRNSTLYGIDAIRHYIAKPYKVFPIDSDYTHSFVQEYVEGITLKALVSRLGYLPKQVLQAGYRIVQTAESYGVHDMDISAGNILTVNHGEDGWAPKLYDFNMLPQHMSPPNPFIAWCLKMGVRSKSHRDYRSLRNWRHLVGHKC